METQLLSSIPRPSDRARSRLVLGGLGTAYAVALGVVYYATVLTVPGRRVSDASLRGALNTQSALADTVQSVLDVVSLGSLAAATLVITVIAALRLAGVAGIVGVGLLVAANGSTWLLKNYLLRRPDLGLDEAAPETMNSLPSGHVTAAFSAVAALVLVLPVATRRLASVLAAVAGALVAVATMSAGWHRAADALAAYCVVGFWTVVGAWVLVHARDRAADEQRWRPPARTVMVSVIGLAVGTAVSVLIAFVDDGSTASPVTAMALFGSVALVVGGAFAAMIGILRAVELTGSGR